MDVEVVTLDREAFAHAIPALAKVYLAAFSPPPYGDSDEDAAAWAEVQRRNAASPPAGFRCCVAREQPAGAIVGFGYGFTLGPPSRRHLWLRAALSPDLADRWLADAFDLIDLAVAPEAQGNGIGGRLHDALLTGQPHQTAVLTALQAETVAMQLYRSRGWVPVAEGVVFPSYTARHYILGLDLQRHHAEPSPPADR